MRGLPVGLILMAMLAGCSPGGSETAGGSKAAAADDETGKVMAAGPPASAGLPEGYQARGEPGWALVIQDRHIAFAARDGRQRIIADLPAPASQPDGLIYATPQLTLRVHYRRCNDVVSGEGFEHEVEVTAAGEKHGGCGGERRPDWDL